MNWVDFYNMVVGESPRRASDPYTPPQPVAFSPVSGSGFQSPFGEWNSLFQFSPLPDARRPTHTDEDMIIDRRRPTHTDENMIIDEQRPTYTDEGMIFNMGPRSKHTDEGMIFEDRRPNHTDEDMLNEEFFGLRKKFYEGRYSEDWWQKTLDEFRQTHREWGDTAGMRRYADSWLNDLNDARQHNNIQVLEQRPDGSWIGKYRDKLVYVTASGDVTSFIGGYAFGDPYAKINEMGAEESFTGAKGIRNILDYFLKGQNGQDFGFSEMISPNASHLTHKFLVEDAVKRGLPVPEEVLRDYPALYRQVIGTAPPKQPKKHTAFSGQAPPPRQQGQYGPTQSLQTSPPSTNIPNLISNDNTTFNIAVVNDPNGPVYELFSEDLAGQFEVYLSSRDRQFLENYRNFIVNERNNNNTSQIVQLGENWRQNTANQNLTPRGSLAEWQAPNMGRYYMRASGGNIELYHEDPNVGILYLDSYPTLGEAEAALSRTVGHRLAYENYLQGNSLQPQQVQQPQRPPTPQQFGTPQVNWTYEIPSNLSYASINHRTADGVLVTVPANLNNPLNTTGQGTSLLHLNQDGSIESYGFVQDPNEIDRLSRLAAQGRRNNNQYEMFGRQWVNSLDVNVDRFPNGTNRYTYVGQNNSIGDFEISRENAQEFGIWHINPQTGDSVRVGTRFQSMPDAEAGLARYIGRLLFNP